MTVELTLVIDENISLDLKITGLEAFARIKGSPGSKSNSTQSDSDGRRGRRRAEYESPEQLSDDSVEAAMVHETPSPTAHYVSKTANPASSAAAVPSATGVDIPVEIYHLPKKHQDFFRRKLDEYQEIYPIEKARDLALQAVRAVAGGPKA